MRKEVERGGDENKNKAENQWRKRKEGGNKEKDKRNVGED